MDQNYDYYVTVQCKKCKKKMGFYPYRVVYLSPCDCGNNDYGIATRDWPNNNYGEFKLVKEEILSLRIPMPWEEKKKENFLAGAGRVILRWLGKKGVK
jgi:hypothetical protein